MNIIRCCLAMLLGLFIKPLMAANVLLIASYDADNEWSNQCIAGIESTIADQHQLKTIYLNTKRLPRSEHQDAAERAWQTFLQTKPDLVLLGDDNAVGLLAKRIAATNTPMVLYGVNDNPRMYFDDALLPDNVAVVLERRLFTPVARLIHQMVPLKHHRILVLFDQSTTSAAFIGNTLRGKTRLRLGSIQAEVLPITHYQQWQQEIINAPKEYDAIVMEHWYTLRDQVTGDIVPDDELLDWSGQHSQLPLFSSVPSSVGPKRAVAAITLSGELHGQVAAQAVLDILANRPVEQLQATETNTYYFSKQGLARFGLTVPDNIAQQAIFNSP
ncbi:hypothetical protein IC617_09680 [Neiella sp. HB171785]|uniref:Sugar ABC transporter substrate-binding protein n=1 Tax=Neiella litorisoli TaxID=2771431 RepID=A0A8J6UEP1_9GAMM|nr:hypothetical protein [Neiella litorisoli]MBD1389699.1 hypothetical protein [Neiella litorisoli]